MTGVEELREVRVVSAAPETIRVSVVGGRTQLDVALPADVPVAAFLPELARLVKSRDTGRGDDAADRDERRTFWVLRRSDRAAAVLEPDRTLRAAGVENGELLHLSARRALSPPTLYDDVVDAAARLNRAAYAAWNATSAGMMAFAGLWLCCAVWVLFLLADELSPYRAMAVTGAVLTTAALVAGAAIARGLLDRADIAAATGPPVIVLSATLSWVLAAGYGVLGLAVGCAVLLGLIALYYRLIRAGHWAYVTAAVVLVFGVLAFSGRALGGRVDVVATVAATAAVLACLAVPVLTAGLDQFPSPTVRSSAARKDDPFSAAEAEPLSPMPSAEQVWARVHSAVLTRVGLLAGSGLVVLVGAAVLARVDSGWPAFAFALACAAVLALRSRRASTWPERAALAVPGLALVLTTCMQAQSGVRPLQFAGVGVLAVLAAAAVLTGVFCTVSRRPDRVRTVASYLEYVAVAAVIPLALWPLGVYERLGL
ncbi:type VII secretion integral membrane protein EccD [Mycolicibacterium sp. XJ870]